MSLSDLTPGDISESLVNWYKRIMREVPAKAEEFTQKYDLKLSFTVGEPSEAAITRITVQGEWKGRKINKAFEVRCEPARSITTLSLYVQSSTSLVSEDFTFCTRTGLGAVSVVEAIVIMATDQEFFVRR